MRHLKVVFELLRTNQLAVKLQKCEFEKRDLQFLGHIITREGVKPDPEKLDAIVRWLLPRDIKGLRGFLGLTGFFRKFIRGYARVATPLTDLLRKDQFIYRVRQGYRGLCGVKETHAMGTCACLSKFQRMFYH